MGVPRLAPWLFRNFRDSKVVYDLNKNEACNSETDPFEKTSGLDHLYIDANGLLHNAAQEVFQYGTSKRAIPSSNNQPFEKKIQKVYSTFWKKIENVIKVAAPQKTIYIAIDGPAPLAKQSQQRQRRFISSGVKIVYSNNASDNNNQNESKPKCAEFDTNCITPGTDFMFNLTRYIETQIKEFITKTPEYTGVVIFSPPSVPGEGEHKIMDYIRDRSEFDNYFVRENSHCIFGPDGDLIMLTLSTHLYKIYLFRDCMDGIHGVYDIIYMTDVRNKLGSIIYDRYSKTSMNRTLNSTSDDFVLAGFLVGNDFLPKIQMFYMLDDGLGAMIKITRHLSKMGKYITYNQKVTDSFKMFISEIAKEEQSFIFKQSQIQPKEQKFVDTILLNSIHNNSFDFATYRYLYYQKANISTESQIAEMCNDYIKTLLWVFDYYTTGLPSWSHYYKYHYAPLMCDLVRYINIYSFSNYSNTFTKGNASLPFVQLLSVLPPISANLLPVELKPLLVDETTPLKKFLPSQIYIDCEGKVKEHMGIVHIPFADINFVKSEYENILKMNPNLKINPKNKLGKNKYFIYNEKLHRCETYLI